MMEYADYEYLLFERLPNGVLQITMNRPEAMNAVNAQLHKELGQIWRTIGDDPDTRVALITGAGRAFCAGGDLFGVDFQQFDFVYKTLQEDRDIVYNMINLDKPIISAINGWAIGAGLAVALLADVSIASDKARIMDGHTRIGVAAGDHAAIIWPLLCGMARAKYYLFTNDELNGEQAAEIGLVSMCVPHDELMDRAREVADRLGRGSAVALRTTKHILNNWLRMNAPNFDASAAFELLQFMGPDVREGVDAVQEKRSPTFPSSAVYPG